MHHPRQVQVLRENWKTEELFETSRLSQLISEHVDILHGGSATWVSYIPVFLLGVFEALVHCGLAYFQRNKGEIVNGSSFV